MRPDLLKTATALAGKLRLIAAHQMRLADFIDATVATMEEPLTREEIRLWTAIFQTAKEAIGCD